MRLAPLVADGLLGDLLLGAGCVGGILAVVLSLASDLRASAGAPDETDPIATMTFANAEVKRRAPRTLVWDRLRPGDTARELDTIFVPPGSSAVFELADGSKLEIDQNSLVVLEAPDARGAAVALVRGNVFGEVGATGLRVRAGSGTTALAAGARASIEIDAKERTRVDVYAGSAAVATESGTEMLGQDSRRVIERGGALASAPAFRVKLVEPEHNARRYYFGEQKHVRLAWSGGRRGERVEVARDRAFTSSVERGGEGGSWELRPAAPGVYYWRIAAPDGVAVSETRKVVVIEDAPPRIIGPAAESVIVPVAGGLQLDWSAVAGVSHYVVELGRDSDGAPLLRTTAARTSVRVTETLQEGYYTWRVRADESERGVSPFSERARFRLLLEALPETPELLDPEFQLDRGATR